MGLHMDAYDSNMPKFKAKDRVVCIDAVGCPAESGAQYIVEKCYNDLMRGYAVKLKGIDYLFYSGRFELVAKKMINLPDWW